MGWHMGSWDDIWSGMWGIRVIYERHMGIGIGVAFVYGNGVDIDLGASNSKASSN